VAKIIANDLLHVYLEDKMLSLETKQPNQKSLFNTKVIQNWTDSKMALIELLHTLHTEDIFKNGASALKDITIYPESIYDINLGQYHRAFLKTIMRK